MIRNLYIGKTTAKNYRTCIKIGIAYDPKKRWSDIDKSANGSEEWLIFSGPVLFAQHFESALHRRYAQHRVDFRGSGKTEWFRMPVLKRVEAVLIVLGLVLLTYAGLVLGVFWVLWYIFFTFNA